MSTTTPRAGLLATAATSLPEAVRKLDPRTVVRQPVLFVVLLGSVAATVLAVLRPSAFGIGVALWLWATMLFAALAEAVAEGRGRAQADSLRRARTETVARRRTTAGGEEVVAAAALAVGDLVVVGPGEQVPADGDVVEGSATVDESAITGESAPVVRESGGDRSAVTGGTTVLSDEVLVRVTSAPGHSFLDRMIALVEGADRRKTPNEVALSVLLTVLTMVFVLAVMVLPPMARFHGERLDPLVLVALLVCLIPTTISALLSAIGIAGMDRLVQRNVVATSGRAVEAAGDVSTLLLDKTGTITHGNRQARDLLPVGGTSLTALAQAARLSSLADATPEGRSVVALVEAEHPDAAGADAPAGAEVVEFSATTRMSGLELPDGSALRKGAASAVTAWVRTGGGQVPADLDQHVEAVSAGGGTPLVVAHRAPGGRPEVLGVVGLQDVVKEGIRERFAEMRALGIRTVMVTGDNEVTARAIAAEAGVDDVLAEATPEDKLRLIKAEQSGGRLVAMAGDGTNDAPALAQADVGVAMNTGTSAAKEAASMVDLDSDPTKILDIIAVGKELLVTRGALTTFSLANDVAKYFAVVPAMFAGTVPGIERLDVMQLASPQSAILSAVVFNALIILVLIPLALRGVRHRGTAAQLLRRNLLVYGVGGLIAPFLGIKLIDLLVSHVPGLV